MKKYNMKFVKKEFNTDLVVSEYSRLAKECGLLECEKKIFNAHLKKEYSILDVGCGTGRVAFSLAELGFNDVSGIDISKKMIQRCKEKAKSTNSKIKFQTKDITSTFFRKNIYDCMIFSFNGLMCIPSKKKRIKAVKNIHKLLKKDGLFIFSCHTQDITANFKNYFEEEKEKWNKNEQSKKLVDFGDIEHPDKFTTYLHIPKESEVLSMLAELNFQVLENVNKNSITSPGNWEKDGFGDFKIFVCRKM